MMHLPPTMLERRQRRSCRLVSLRSILLAYICVLTEISLQSVGISRVRDHDLPTRGAGDESKPPLDSVVNTHTEAFLKTFAEYEVEVQGL